jgi:hypothetical protein
MRCPADAKNPENQTISAPEGLSRRSQRLWRSVTEGWELEDHHRELLAEGLRALDRADAARAVLERDGLTFPDRWGQPREHPLVDVERKSRGQFKDIMRALDLKPEAGID